MDLNEIMQKAQALQAKMAEASEKLKTITETGESGGGMVKVVATADGKISKIEIDPELLSGPDDLQMVGDLIVAAANQALQKAEATKKHEMSQQTQGLLPNIPGLNLF